MKFIDDLTVGETVRLDKALGPSPGLISPFNFHDRNGLILPKANSKVQGRLNDLQKYVENHQMVLNCKKTKIQPFNFSRKYDFTPQLSIGELQLDVVYETRLLGVTITSDCKWNTHISNLVNTGNRKIWFVRRLKSLGASTETLVDIYKLFVRQGLELAAPLWSGALRPKPQSKLCDGPKVGHIGDGTTWLKPQSMTGDGH